MKKLELKQIIREEVRRVLKEASIHTKQTEFVLDDLPKGAIVTFKDGETWIVTKTIGNRSNPRGYLMAPYGKTKDHYISVAIEFSMKKLEDDTVSIHQE